MWLPVDAEASPVPAILEYLPYRRREGTAERDALTHPYVAGHGYACVRVDMRGSGDSEGVLTDEYLPLEQDDAVEVIAWLAAQPWCTGRVGMMGHSWGGFNALQVAARRPPALRAILTSCSTDDRYADDIHYMGGALLLDNLRWASTMFAHNSRPPDPAVVGDRWRELWLARLRGSGLWLDTWLRHQRRDAFWRQGSVCEDFSAIECPVFAVGGWLDALLQRGAAAHGGARRAAPGPDRPVGAPLPPHGAARARRGLPSARPPLVGHVAQGPRRRRRTASRPSGSGCRTASARRRCTRPYRAAGSGSAPGRPAASRRGATCSIPRASRPRPGPRSR